MLLIGIIILGFTVIAVSTAYAFLLIKYKSLRSKIDSYIIEMKKPLKYGYYKLSLTMTEPDKDDIDFESVIYVKELDRYTNGDSKIQIDKIESCISEAKMSHDRVEKHIRDGFKSIVKTSNIEWLESEETIKTQRKNKLEHLKENLKDIIK